MKNHIRDSFRTAKQWIYQSHESAIRGWRLLWLRIVRFFVLLGHLFIEDRILQRASSLSYTTILSIFPLLAVMTVMASVFTGGGGKLEDQIVDFIEQAIVPPVTSPVEDWLNKSQAQEIQKKRENLEEITQSVRKMFRAFRENATEIGFLGFIGVLLAAGLLYATVEKAFNEMWNVYDRRSPLRTLTTFTTLIVCAPLLIGLSVTVSVHVIKFNQKIKKERTEQRLEQMETPPTAKRVPATSSTASRTRTGEGITTVTLPVRGKTFNPPLPVVPLHSRIAAALIPPIINGIFLALAYMLIPRTKVSAGYALVGGLAAGFIWEVLKLGFGVYVFSSTLQNALFRSLGVVPIFLIWIYFTWVVFLAGNEFVYILHNYRTLRRERFARPRYTTLDSKLIFSVALLIADSFERNSGGMRYEDLKAALGIKDAELHSALTLLRRHRFVVRTDNRTYTLTRPAHNLPVKDVLELGCNVPKLFHSPDRKTDRIEGVLEDLQQNLESWQSGRTLHDVLSSLKPVESNLPTNENPNAGHA